MNRPLPRPQSREVSVVIQDKPEHRSAVIARNNARIGIDRPEYKSANPYRAFVHQELNFAAKCRRAGQIDLARRAVALAARGQHAAGYWQPIP